MKEFGHRPQLGHYDTMQGVPQLQPRAYGELPQWEGALEKRPQKEAGLQSYINYFDTNYAREGLPKDWYNLRTIEQKHVGFVIKNQMDLLQSIIDKKALADWAVKTERDLQGFKLEFLSEHNVYTRRYDINYQKGRIEDPMYGKAKDGVGSVDIVDTISAEERNGSVKESLGEIKEFLLDAPDGSIGFMNSPLGKTGFKSPDGRGIDYIDSYVFLLQKQGDKVMNYTIKTDFKLPQCREAIERLTGKKLPENAPLEEYVRSIALIKPGKQGINNLFDVVNVLEAIQPSHAFKDEESGQNRSWRHVYEDILQGEELYSFDAQTSAVIKEFGAYANEGEHSKEDLQKAIAVTVLRMSELFFQSQNTTGGDMQPNVWISPNGAPPKTFGDVLKQAAARRGCSGGGQKFNFTNALGTRQGVAAPGEKQDEWFNCPKCSYKANGPVGNSCPGCGLTKTQYAQESGISCD